MRKFQNDTELFDSVWSALPVYEFSPNHSGTPCIRNLLYSTNYYALYIIYICILYHFICKQFIYIFYVCEFIIMINKKIINDYDFIIIDLENYYAVVMIKKNYTPISNNIC